MTPSFVTYVDADRFAATPEQVRLSQKVLLGSALDNLVSLVYIRTPPGGGSPRGLHTHDHDQIFFIVDGTMTVQLGDERVDVGAGGVVVFPAGEEHGNWNQGTVPTVHLAINIEPRSGA